MIQVEQMLETRQPSLLTKSPILKSSAVNILKQLLHQDEINAFLETHKHLFGFEFIDKVLEHFNFAYQVSQLDRPNIPATGRVLIIANHPLGALDGLALVKLISEVRPDVKIIANDMLSQFDALDSLVLPVNNMDGKADRKQIQQIMQSLHNDEAVIMFPAGEVSRLSGRGIHDTKWNQSYLKLAQKTNSPLLPIHISGRNSVLFYTSSLVYRPLSTIQLANEMFKQKDRSISFKIGQAIETEQLAKLPISNKEKNKLVKRHLYRIAKGKKPLLQTQKTIAHPQSRQHIKQELKQAELLGKSQDGKLIYLFDYQPQSATMQEIGRLREVSFRQVGEGTGQAYDLDNYDKFYRHLVLWDDEELEIVGAYRIGETARYLEEGLEQNIYSAELFNYHKDMTPYFAQGIELGRSFVQPKYWGKRSLDYLWYGIGAYLNRHPNIRYMFGPVSLSNHYPAFAKDLIVSFYRLHFADTEKLAHSFTPYHVNSENQAIIQSLFKGESYKEDFAVLKEQLRHLSAVVPTLYKQYTEVCEEGGVRFLDFGVDAEFGFCIDGLVLVDLSKIKPNKNQRYRGEKLNAD